MALGILSLVVWTLLITTSLKYVAIVMRADNDGEGGILALMSLLGVKHGERWFVIALGIIGAAMLYGDGAITPAISVLSALEGLKDPLPSFAPYVLPLSVAVLVAVFALQPQGTARIGALFGPIMTIWFITIGVLGIAGVLFRTVQLFLVKDVQTGLVWATKILTDPFHDIKIYHKAPLALMRGELIDPDIGRHRWDEDDAEDIEEAPRFT